MTGKPAAGLTDELLISVKACINDYRRQMCVLRGAGALPLRTDADAARLESVLLCGGGSRMKGLDTRLLRELTAAAPATVRPV